MYYGVHTLSYAVLSTKTTFSKPCTLAASSATAFAPPPATNPIMLPPSFCAAATAASDEGFSFPSFCSSTASDDSNRASADSCGNETGCVGRRAARACRRAVCRVDANIVVYVCQCQLREECGVSGDHWQVNIMCSATDGGHHPLSDGDWAARIRYRLEARA